MKVSSVELKTRLGHYLRVVERGGAPVEISVRNHPVAMLVPYGEWEPAADTNASTGRRLVHTLQGLGLKVESASVRGQPPVLAEPVVAGDGRVDVVTVAEMRGDRDW
jgi:prevent-host-death family protein